MKQVANSQKQIAYNEYDRESLDWYCEPRWCVESLLDHVSLFPKMTILDPCAGRGNIVRTAFERGYYAIGTDIAGARDGQFSDWVWEQPVDFLTTSNEAFTRMMGGWPVNAIVMNPPFFHSEGAKQFIDKAKLLATDLVAAIVPISFLNSQTRRDWYNETRGMEIAYLSRRPSMPPGTTLMDGEDGKGGKRDYCWLIYRLKESFNRPPIWL